MSDKLKVGSEKIRLFSYVIPRWRGIRKVYDERSLAVKSLLCVFVSIINATLIIFLVI